MASELESAAWAVIEAQRKIWRLWQDTPQDDPVEQRLDFANGELVNIIEDLQPYSEAARAWRPNNPNRL
jgi:hypothetical protein